MGAAGFTEAVDSFAAALALERGLADKTQEAYLRDVRALVRFLDAKGVQTASAVTRADISGYLDVLRSAFNKANCVTDSLNK
jgi:site-specific recombinase XerD